MKDGLRNNAPPTRNNTMLMSLCSGCGGLDLGFENAGFEIGSAFEIDASSVDTYNHNRASPSVCVKQDITEHNFLEKIPFSPDGIIGGPPCQSFSRANTSRKKNDPRQKLVVEFARIVSQMNARSRVSFSVIENVPQLFSGQGSEVYKQYEKILNAAGFNVSENILNALDYGVPQKRKRLFSVALNRSVYGEKTIWRQPDIINNHDSLTLQKTIGKLPAPVFYKRKLDMRGMKKIHFNHWCMNPISDKFRTPGALKEGDVSRRSFKTLSNSRPSETVSYGNREVHVHPSGKRRLSVYEAMLLQGFPANYELLGNLSSQIYQVSQAVPPPMAEQIAYSVKSIMKISD